MADNGQDSSFLDKYEVKPAAQSKADGGNDTSFLDKYEQKDPNTEWGGFTPSHLLQEGVAHVGQLAKGLVIDLPKNIYHSAVDPITPEEQAKYTEGKQKLQAVAPILAHQPDQMSRGVGTTASRLLKTYVTDPANEEERLQHEAEARSAANRAAGKPMPYGNDPDKGLAIVHKEMKYLPMIGPAVGRAFEKANSGDLGGAIVDTGIDIAAPKITEEAVGLAGKVPGAVGKAIDVAKDVHEGGMDAVKGHIETITTPKNVGRTVGASGGAALGAHIPVPGSSIAGFKYGADVGGNLTERVLGPERANAPLIRLRKPATPPIEVPQFRTQGELFEGTGKPGSPEQPNLFGSEAQPEAPEAPAEEPQGAGIRVPGVSVNKQIEQIANKATGYSPIQLKPDVPLREQLHGSATETPQQRLERLYPENSDRQMVHVQGERAFKSTGGRGQAMSDLHGLTAVDLREALIKAGEDMGQGTVTDSKFRSPQDMTRQEAINKLLDKGLTAPQIKQLIKVEKR